MTIKNALLNSVVLFVDLTTIHLTLHFTYADGTQKAGPLKLTDDLLIALASVADEREISKIKDKPCRVEIGAVHGEIVSFSHFLRDDWFPLTQ